MTFAGRRVQTMPLTKGYPPMATWTTQAFRVWVQTQRSTGVSDRTFLSLLLLGSLCINLWLGLKVRALSSPPDFTSLAVTGVMLPRLTCTDLTGKPETIDFSGGKGGSVLYIFNPDCGWCAKNLENIRALAAARTDLRFIGISVISAKLTAYVQSSGLRFPVCSIASYGDIHELKLGATPQTIVIAPDGKVAKNWIGAYTAGQQKEIESYFEIKLPGLVSGTVSLQSPFGTTR